MATTQPTPPVPPRAARVPIAGRPDLPNFNTRARAKIADPSLHDALEVGLGRVRGHRDAAFWALANAPELRERAYEIKRDVMRHLDHYLAQAAEAVERAGGHVFFARDGAEAVRYVGDVLRAKGAKTVVKSKSMVSEEIELNAHLAELHPGLEVVETDLGEWIAQLAHDTPSHLIAPIIHMNRRQIAAVLSREAGEEIPPTVEDLMQFARRRLRAKFLAADVGISGANFVVAESGTLALVTNEGNGRLTTSLPRTHIAITGIEKVLPRFADLGVFLQLLARSGTGQQLTVYTHLVTGPRRPGDADGPEDLHLVFVDNGRSNILGTEFEEALYCIRCGACLNVCPVYRQTGGHAYGSTYAGPIGAVITPLLRSDHAAQELPYASSLCGACSETCPVGIPLHELLLKLRARSVRQGEESRAEGLAMAGFREGMRHPALYTTGAAMARAAQRPFRGKPLPIAPGPLGAWARFRTVPEIAPASFHERWRALSDADGTQDAKKEGSDG